MELGAVGPGVVILLPPTPTFCAAVGGACEGAANLLVEDLGLVDPLVAVLPGFCVILTSWLPSGIGPDGLAGQEPAGETGALIPNGIVPLWPTGMPPTKVLGLSP